MTGAIIVALSPEKRPVVPPREIEAEVERIGEGLVSILLRSNGHVQWHARVSRAYANNLATALLEVSE